MRRAWMIKINEPLHLFKCFLLMFFSFSFSLALRATRCTFILSVIFPLVHLINTSFVRLLLLCASLRAHWLVYLQIVSVLEKKCLSLLLLLSPDTHSVSRDVCLCKHAITRSSFTLMNKLNHRVPQRSTFLLLLLLLLVCDADCFFLCLSASLSPHLPSTGHERGDGVTLILVIIVCCCSSNLKQFI